MSIFKFKQFNIDQTNSAMKIGTDAMIFGALIETTDKKNGLDIGTGTGVLSLMVAQNNPSLQIKAIEIEENAFLEAKTNFEKSPFQNQLQAIYSDIKEFHSENQFDLIFTNPPYFANSSKSVSGERNLARHTDALSWKELALKVSELLSDDGDFWVILPLEGMQLLREQLQELNFFLNQEIILFGKENQAMRNVYSFSKTQKQTTKREIIIRQADNQYTDAYKKLTIEYHFNTL
ncbi:MAG: methyltransferase [Crocinitomicaceae bacterium]|nr:methyltransferase [Crocinitomicaceae bacterium]